MKTPRQYISEIRPDEMNFKHIATSGKINATLMIDIERVMKEYAKQWVDKLAKAMDKNQGYGSMHPESIVNDIKKEIDAQ